ncbi:MAG: hypothetical protein ACI8WY_002786 [Planctomycetota bacterium]|jgi:hypothetical protein
MGKAPLGPLPRERSRPNRPPPAEPMTSKRLLRSLRVLFFSICVLAAATKFVWERHPDLVSWVDENLKKRSVHEEVGALRRGQEHFRRGESAAGIEVLTRLAESMAGVLNGDRLEPTKIQTLKLLTNAHDGLGQLDQALRWSDELHALDPRLVTAELRRASLLTRSGRIDEALATLAPVVALSSVANLEVNTKLLAELSRAGEIHGALAILIQLGDQGPLGLPLDGWEVRQRTGETWSDPRRFSILRPEGARQGLYDTMVELPAVDADGSLAQWSALRIDAPRGSSFSLWDPTFTLLAPDATVAAELGPADLGKPRNMTLHGNVLSATGHSDPYIVVQAPGSEPLEALTLRLQFELRPALPAELSAMLGTAKSAQAIARLREELRAKDSWDQPGAYGSPAPKELMERLEALLDA